MKPRVILLGGRQRILALTCHLSFLDHVHQLDATRNDARSENP